MLVQYYFIMYILEDLTHKMEGQPRKKEVSWVLGLYIILKTNGSFFHLQRHFVADPNPRNWELRITVVANWI